MSAGAAVGAGSGPVPSGWVQQRSDEAADGRTHQEYLLWRRHAPLLYSVAQTHALEWPSLTVQWLPDALRLRTEFECFDDSPYFETHQALVGTLTTGSASDSLLLVNVRLPIPVRACHPEDAACSREWAPEADAPRDGVSLSSALRDGPWQQRLDEELPELERDHRIHTVRAYRHQMEIHRARHVPQLPTIVATKSPSAEVAVFDLERPEASARVLKLAGHSKGGWALAWSRARRGHLLSGADDCRVCLWDIDSSLSDPSEPDAPASSSSTPAGTSAAPEGPGRKRKLPPAKLKAKGRVRARGADSVRALRVFEWHRGVVEDLDWAPHHQDLFVSVADDCTMALGDLRIKSGLIAQTRAHSSDVNSVSFNPIIPHSLATGSKDRSVHLWDTRNTRRPVLTLSRHTSDVFQVRWAPFGSGNVLASTGADRRVLIWDLARVGVSQSAQEEELGPPELLFIHGGHTSRVSEFDWHPDRQWLLGSVDDGNILMAWQPAPHAVAPPRSLLDLDPAPSSPSQSLLPDNPPAPDPAAPPRAPAVSAPVIVLDGAPSAIALVSSRTAYWAKELAPLSRPASAEPVEPSTGLATGLEAESCASGLSNKTE